MDEFKIKFVDDKTNYIARNRTKENNELIISDDIKTTWTEDGKLCAIFQNHEQIKPTFMDMLRDLCGKRYIPDNSDCSIIIDDISKFHYCKKENGEYILFGGGVTFKGTKHDDKLVMYESENTSIDLGDGNDTVRIEDANGFHGDFTNNKINTGNGNDIVVVKGNFNKFKNNKINLGKGSDKFIAEINLEDDVQTHAEFASKFSKYGSAIAENEIYAIDGCTKDGDKAGWFECDIFESKTYSANQLFRYNFLTGEMKGLDGFQLYKFKPEPKQVFITEPKVTQPIQEDKKTKPKTKITREDYQTSYFANSFLAWFGVKGAQDAAFKTLSDYVKSMSK